MISASTLASSTRISERSDASLRGTGRSARSRNDDAAQGDDVAPDLDTEFVEEPPGQRAGRDARRGLAGTGSLEDVARIHADRT